MYLAMSVHSLYSHIVGYNSSESLISDFKNLSLNLYRIFDLTTFGIIIAWFCNSPKDLTMKAAFGCYEFIICGMLNGKYSACQSIDTSEMLKHLAYDKEEHWVFAYMNIGLLYLLNNTKS